MDAATALDTLSNLLTSISESPYSLRLYAEHIKLVSLPLPELAEQFNSAVQLLLSFHTATISVWLPYLQGLIQAIGVSEDFETSEESTLVDLQDISASAILSVLDAFHQAENDYLSIPVLRKKIKFLTVLHASYASQQPSPELEPLLSEACIRSTIAEAVSKGSSHLTEGHLLWELQVAWELGRLEDKDPGSAEREALKAHIETLHLERLRQPHSTHERTLQSYSSFITTHFNPAEYESRLVAASQVRRGPAKAWSNKERYELGLANSSSRESYQTYISSEQRVKSHYPNLLSTLYERAIAEYANKRWNALTDGSGAKVVEDFEEILRSFWCEYIDSTRASDEGDEISILRRAVRSVPGSGEVWARYIRALEHAQDDAEEMEEDHSSTKSVSDVYADALATSLVQQRVDQILPLFLAKAGFQKRRLKDEEGFYALVKTLEDGIAYVRKAVKEGDPQLTLEKYLAGVYLNLETPFNEQALALWQSTAKHYKTSCLAWTKYSEVLISQHEYTRARALFKEICPRKLDWPEAIWQSWIDFEHLHGTLDDIEHCLEKVQSLSTRLEKRRAQEVADAQRAWLEAAQSIPTENEKLSPVEAVSEVPIGGTNSLEQSNKKRKTEETIDTNVTKRAKVEERPTVKRDRENSTVFVSGLAAGNSEDSLAGLFQDCGKIREIKLTQLPDSLVATVEFTERESVPAALTKDKKRINGQEIVVHLAWRSTLYVTNFPEKFDDASIRELFGSHGQIFDIRWPSKKYKSTRRFCYVQYTSPSAAESALSLHGHELDQGRNLTVYISNPEHKQERTDAMADAREIYVAGLNKSVKENDLLTLFEEYGTISCIRLILDDKGNAKGFAFIEFESEDSAKAALAANNRELKKRRIAVTLSDTRAQPRQRERTSDSQARRSRSLRVKNLPPGTQEGLLQQSLEKYADVKRVEVFKDKHEAIVELATVAEAGKLLLMTEPITFGDRALELINEDLPASSRESGRSGPIFVPRGAAGRPRAGLGSKKAMTSISAAQNTSVELSTLARGSGPGMGQNDFRRMLSASRK